MAAPIWLEFMQTAMGDRPVNDFVLPEGISFAYIDPKTGLRAAPGSGAAILECFRRGTEPQAVTLVAATPPAQDSDGGGTLGTGVSFPETVVHSAEGGF